VFAWSRYIRGHILTLMCGLLCEASVVHKGLGDMITCCQIFDELCSTTENSSCSKRLEVGCREAIED